MSKSDKEEEEGLSGDSDSEPTDDSRASNNTTSISSNSENGSKEGGEQTCPRPQLGHAKSFPIPTTGDAAAGGKQKSVSETSSSVEDRPPVVKRKESVSFNPFGALGKAVGSGVNMVGHATKAVGTGVVQGTKAVGTGVVKGTQAVGSGLVSTAETVGSGVVSAAESVGDGVVSGVAAVSCVVVETGEAVGSAAVSGVTAVGEATKRTANTVSKSVDDSTTWVREKRKSVLLHAKPYKQHRVEDGETLAIIAAKYKTTTEDILLLNKEKLPEVSGDLVPGTKIKVPVREKRKSHKNSTDFLSNLSSAFADIDDMNANAEQVDTRCIILSNTTLGPNTITPGYLIMERDCIILSWGADLVIHVELENIQGLNMLYGEDELSDFILAEPQEQEQQVGGHSLSETEVFPVWDEQPELEDSHSSVGTQDTSPRPKTEDSDEITGSLKNLESFDEPFPGADLSRSKSEDRGQLDEDERVFNRRRSRRRTTSKDRRQSLLFEDTMSTYLIMEVKKTGGGEWVGCEVRETPPQTLPTEEARFLMRVPNEMVVKLFSMLNRHYGQVYGNVEFGENTGLSLITMDALQSGAGDSKVAKVLASKGSMDDKDIQLPPMSDLSEVLEPPEIEALAAHLPPRVENHTWFLAFSTHRDGFSLSTFYRKLSSIESPVLIAIQDFSENIFGSLLSEAPQVTDTFTGTGESWLYSFPLDPDQELNVYSWSKKNQLFVQGCVSSLAIGAGEGRFGIWFDEDLNHGRSQSCDTFDNPPLTPEQDFRVKCLEVWAFVCSG